MNLGSLDARLQPGLERVGSVRHLLLQHLSNINNNNNNNHDNNNTMIIVIIVIMFIVVIINSNIIIHYSAPAAPTRRSPRWRAGPRTCPREPIS